MAKQSNTIGHILIELNTAVNVPCHWSDKNRVQGKSRLKPFECVYIAKVGKFFTPSASSFFLLLFLLTILFTLENTCRILTSSLSETWHINMHSPIHHANSLLDQTTEFLFPICTQGNVNKNYSKNWEASTGWGHGHLDQLQAVFPAGRHKWWNTEHYCF